MGQKPGSVAAQGPRTTCGPLELRHDVVRSAADVERVRRVPRCAPLRPSIRIPDVRHPMVIGDDQKRPISGNLHPSGRSDFGAPSVFGETRASKDVWWFEQIQVLVRHT
jgi:hypothetical protein